MIHRISRFLTSSDSLWFVVRPFVKFAEGLRYYRNKKLDEPFIQEIRKVLKDPVVIHGPFKGLRYPDFSSFGSAIYPKILGSYEREIFPFLQKILQTQYDSVIDVGCAEGYYTVGIALKNPSVKKIVAVDISETALAMVKKVAVLNGVDQKMEFSNGMSALQLGSVCEGKRNFVLSDCEGFEKDLFSVYNIEKLRNCDVLIEVHDAKIMGLSKYLVDLFSKTHRISRVSSTDDIQKMNNYEYAETKGLSDKARKLMLTEGRGSIQEWFFCEPL
jgi:SAM-dependent methyltransferase